MNTLLDSNIKKTGEYSPYELCAVGTIWKDSTSYSRGQRGNIEPNAFSLDLKEIRIYITAGHIHYKGTWIMGCNQLNLKEVKCINCTTATEAAEYAVKAVRQKIEKMSNAIKNLE